MAVLTRSDRAGRALGLAALAALAGCALLRRLAPGERALAFSHEIHVVGERLDCFSCHETAMVDDDPGLPSPDTCAVCHDELDLEKQPERRVASLFEDGRFRAARVSALADEVIFSHKAHAGGYGECAECHAGIDTNRRVGPELAVDMAGCVACHARKEAPGECAACHAEIDLDWAPRSHAGNWMRVHGGVARSPCERSEDDCGICHSESSCVECHLERPPASHNNHFRLRGHGVQAMMDRASCAVCHRSDSCDRCHREVLPLNHVGQWGGTRSMHCLTCHFPLKAEGCVTCHKGTPSHLLGAPKPPDHNAAMNCRLCHGVNQPLPHADKGDDCNACHP